jgi:hypothetical protein
MTAFPPNRATNLKAAYRICTPEPLDGEDLELYYVNLAEVRKSEAIAGVSTILDFQEPGDHGTILFTGHRGCGKSTELKRLQRQWQKNFHVIYIYQFERDRCDLAYNEPVLAKMASVIEQRVEVDAVFAERESLLDLVRSSGGHVRQLMQMMQTACLTASTRGHARIEADDVLYAVNKAQFEFERLIPSEHYPLLAQTCMSKNVDKDETGQLMLFNTSVLEYNGSNRWNDVNPLVKKIDAFQQSLQDISG